MNRLFLELVQGLFIGAGGILPGISGASLAVVFGYYRELTDLVAHPVKNARSFIVLHWGLACGIAAGFILTTLLLDRVFAEHQNAIVFLFWGFIAGTIPSIWKDARKSDAGFREAIAFFVTAAAMIALAVASGGHGSPFAAPAASSAAANAASGVTASGAAEASAISAIGEISAAWFLSGAIVGAGSLLPGVSASFILVYLGLYGPMLDAAGRLSLPILAQIGAGALASIILLSRAISALYRRYRGIVAFGVLGFTLGSLVLVFPGFPATVGAIAPSLLPAVAGLALSLFLDRATR